MLHLLGWTCSNIHIWLIHIFFTTRLLFVFCVLFFNLFQNLCYCGNSGPVISIDCLLAFCVLFYLFIISSLLMLLWLKVKKMIIYAMLELVEKLEKTRLVVLNFAPYGYGLVILIEYMLFTLLWKAINIMPCLCTYF